jgi:hypothetical protein
LNGRLERGSVGFSHRQRDVQIGPRSDGDARAECLFVFTDQERYHARWRKGLSLPAHERLERTGWSDVHQPQCQR